MKKLVLDNFSKFVEFLKEHKAFSKFERNRIQSNKRFHSRGSLKGHIEVCDRQEAVYIGSAFAWGLTDEGREFWKVIDNIWVNENQTRNIPV